MANNEPKSQQKFRDSDDFHVNEIHKRIVAREQLEPEEGFETPPWWVWVVSVLVLFAMGFYLGRYGGSWSTVAHEAEQPMVYTVNQLVFVCAKEDIGNLQPTISRHRTLWNADELYWKK